MAATRSTSGPASSPSYREWELDSEEERLLKEKLKRKRRELRDPPYRYRGDEKRRKRYREQSQGCSGQNKEEEEEYKEESGTGNGDETNYFQRQGREERGRKIVVEVARCSDDSSHEPAITRRENHKRKNMKRDRSHSQYDRRRNDEVKEEQNVNPSRQNGCPTPNHVDNGDERVRNRDRKATRIQKDEETREKLDTELPQYRGSAIPRPMNKNGERMRSRGKDTAQPQKGYNRHNSPDEEPPQRSGKKTSGRAGPSYNRSTSPYSTYQGEGDKHVSTNAELPQYRRNITLNRENPSYDEISSPYRLHLRGNDMYRKQRTPRSSSPIPDSQGSESEAESVEETILTAGARKALFPREASQSVVEVPEDADGTFSEQGDVVLESDGDGDDEEEPGPESQEVMPRRHTGFPAPEEIPNWFPDDVKQIYHVDRHGGALKFKEFNLITRYRAALEVIRRQKWRMYLHAGENRWKLQRALQRLQGRPLTEGFLAYRRKQSKLWKKKALKAWKRLEKTHLGVLILDETININFRQERMIYEKKLGGRL